MVIWAKTEAGRAEIGARALVKDRARRNLLLVIDGRKTDQMLLEHLAGISAQDFTLLESLGLIAPAGSAADAVQGGSAHPPVDTAPAVPVVPVVPVFEPATAAPAPSAAPAVPPDYPQFTAALTQLTSRELALRGFMLTLAVEKASTPEELRAVADRALAQVRERRGEASAAAASRALFGA